jgi:hypothetical protein
MVDFGEKHTGDLVGPVDLSAQLAPLQKSGIIERFVGDPQRSMDPIIQRHLDQIALLEARGDVAPERSIYILIPDS